MPFNICQNRPISPSRGASRPVGPRPREWVKRCSGPGQVLQLRRQQPRGAGRGVHQLQRVQGLSRA
eukprot:3347650-Pyramimonas_sp.AAC.1